MYTVDEDMSSQLGNVLLNISRVWRCKHEMSTYFERSKSHP